MSERTFAVELFGVEYVCDDCGEGTMRPHGQVVWMTMPIQFPHRCDKCGAERGLTTSYPTTGYRRITPAQDNTNG